MCTSLYVCVPCLSIISCLVCQSIYICSACPSVLPDLPAYLCVCHVCLSVLCVCLFNLFYMYYPSVFLLSRLPVLSSLSYPVLDGLSCPSCPAMSAHLPFPSKVGGSFFMFVHLSFLSVCVFCLPVCTVYLLISPVPVPCLSRMSCMHCLSVYLPVSISICLSD